MWNNITIRSKWSDELEAIYFRNAWIKKNKILDADGLLHWLHLIHLNSCCRCRSSLGNARCFWRLRWLKSKSRRNWFRLEKSRWKWQTVERNQNEEIKEFFVVVSELKKKKQTERQMVKKLRKQPKTLYQAIDLIESNSHQLMACLQYFYTCNQGLKLQINLESSPIAPNNEIIRCRNATLAYRTSWNAVMTIARKRIPKSLLPKQALKKILNSVTQKQNTSNDGFTLGIPPILTLSYYATKFFLNVGDKEFRMVFLFVMLFASGCTALKLYIECSIPLPTNDSDGYA